MNDACNTCRYYKANPNGGEYGHCRRYPPQLAYGVSSDTDSTGESLQSVESYEASNFPESHKDDWCGEFKQQEPKP